MTIGRASKRTLALASAALIGLLALGASSLPAQDAGGGGGERRQAGGGGGQDREAARKMRQEMIAKLKQMVPASKTALPAAITSVEQETKGKVYRAAFAVDREGKLSIQIGVILNDKLGEVTVDPETGKASAPRFDDDAAPGGRRGERREGGGQSGE